MKKKYIKIIGLLMAVVMCVVMVACSGSTNPEATYDFEKNFRELSLNGDEYANMGELVDAFENLSNDGNTCIVNFDSVSKDEIEECGLIYDNNKEYKHIKFTHITDYSVEVPEYNFIASMDNNGKVVPEVVTFSSSDITREYESNPQLILNGLQGFVEKEKVMISLSDKYDG